MTRLLVVSHDAARTGAPIGLKHLVQHWTTMPDIDPVVLLAKDGPLRREYVQEGIPTLVLPPQLHWSWRDGKTRKQRQVQTALRRAWIRHYVGAVDVAYLNTTMLGPLAIDLQGQATRIICHVHELSHWLRTRVHPDDRDWLFSRSYHLVACSLAVRDVLVNEYKVSPDRILVQTECVPPPTPHVARAEARLALHVPAERRIVGGFGTADHRKGIDIFVWAAAALHRARPDLEAHFLWLGAATEPRLLEWVLHDARAAGLDGRFDVLGVQADPANIVQTFDVLALTSREDPYPLAMLEAAALGVPVVAMDGTGGASEFLANGRGTTVAYGDVDSYASALADVLTLSPSERASLAGPAMEYVLKHHAPEAAAERIASAVLGSY